MSDQTAHNHDNNETACACMREGGSAKAAVKDEVGCCGGAGCQSSEVAMIDVDGQAAEVLA